MIDLHYSATPNGQKIAIMLEEIGEPYRVIPYDIFDGDQLTAEFGRINPNHKLPAIVDQDPAEGGDPITVFESGAILQYLAEKSRRFLPASGAARAATLSWLTWQVAGLGPMGGQASHFLRYAPAGQDYAIDRYTKEVKRLLTVLENGWRRVPMSRATIIRSPTWRSGRAALPHS
ncbi:glutathione S-transferase N-terminal domain-containing protein [Sphingopyxis sp.]|uniref:glutathione S-transferase N-terminal domain-containing protein n=1 Tax=Sphingopyxis sp. TaxID=1908224 RepID=UPI0025F65C22|nr:glutathione S-transferase N-terminal domain-containing protein [Sphingopyxis sp.]